MPAVVHTARTLSCSAARIRLSDSDATHVTIDARRKLRSSKRQPYDVVAECVDLKFFCGFSFGEIAELRQVSERTVQRDWNKARILLRHFLR